MNMSYYIPVMNINIFPGEEYKVLMENIGNRDKVSLFKYSRNFKKNKRKSMKKRKSK